MGFSAVPLGQKFSAVLLAAAVGGGVYSYYRHNAMEAASTAELSFDMHAARRIDAGLVQSHDPGVIFADSVLTDQRLADLSKSAYLSTSALMSRVGELRSRLVLTQPSAQVVRVRFEDPDPAKAADTANTVANALTTWGPSPNGPAALTEPTPVNAPATTPSAAAKPSTPAAPPAPKAEAPKPAPPVKKAAEAGGNEEAASLATALGNLQSQLATLSRQVEEGGSSSRGRAYAQSEQQQLLKSQVRAAESKAADLRSKATGEDKQRLGQIQQALSSVLAGGSVGVSAGQLRRERDALTRALAVVEEQHEAVEKEASAGSAPDAASEAPTAPAAEPSAPAKTPAAASGAGSIAESDVGRSAAGSAAQPAPATQNAPAAESLPDGEDAAMQNPLRVTRLAGTAATVVWWPAAAAGFVVGLLYWLIAAARAGSSDYAYADIEEGSSHYARFITPDAPVTPSFVPATEPVARDFVARDVQERVGSGRRASFTYEPPREEPGAMVQAAPVVEEARIEPPPPAQPEPSAMAEVREEPATPFHEKVVEMDPWADLMQKALSETEIGKKYETPKDRAEGKESPMRPDRLAG